MAKTSQNQNPPPQRFVVPVGQAVCFYAATGRDVPGGSLAVHWWMGGQASGREKGREFERRGVIHDLATSARIIGLGLLANVRIQWTDMADLPAPTPRDMRVRVGRFLAVSIHMKDYRGKRVEVTGYYKSGIELSALYQNQDDAKSFRDARALWIMPFVKPGHEKQVKFVKEGMVRIVGVFDYNARQPELGVGHLNQWPAQLVALEVFEEIK